MDLSMVTEILGLLQRGQVEQALGHVSMAVSGLALAGPTRHEIAATARGRCQLGSFGTCDDCGKSISTSRLAKTNLAARFCTLCSKQK